MRDSDQTPLTNSASKGSNYRLMHVQLPALLLLLFFFFFFHVLSVLRHFSTILYVHGE